MRPIKPLTIDFKSKDGSVPMRARIVRKGEGYGRFNAETNAYPIKNTSTELFIEFYDMNVTTTKDPMGGRYLTRNLMKDFLARDKFEELVVHLEVPEWDVHPRDLEKVTEWARGQQKRLDSKLHKVRTMLGMES